jgi:hypothetical protein
LSHVRSRWTALPLVLALAVPALTVLPATATAAEPADYRGALTMTASGPRYTVTDTSSGTTVFTSPGAAVDGTLGAATADGPTVLWVSLDPAGAGTVQRLHLTAPDGRDAVLYSAAPESDVSEPDLDVQGTRAVFLVDDDTTSALLTVDVASRAVRTLRRSTSETYYGPSFSPDGRYLSWVRDSDTASTVLTTAFDGTDETVVTSSDGTYGTYGDTAWSPDGQRLALSWWATATDVVSLHVRALRSGDTTEVAIGSSSNGTDTSYLEPAWTSDGSALLVTKVVETQTGYDTSLVRVEPREAAPQQAVEAGRYLGSPATPPLPLAQDSTAPPAVRPGGTRPHADLASVWWNLDLYASANQDVEDFVVTRVAGTAADTPTATITAARTRSTLLDIPLPAPDTDYGISVFARDWSGNLAPAAKLQVRSTPRSAVALDPLPAKVVSGAGIRVSGKVSTGVGNALVSLYQRRAGTSTPVLVRTARTATGGAFAFSSLVPQWTAEYQVRYAGSDADYPSVSAKRVVSVTPLVSLALSATRTTVGRAVTLAGGVRPAHAGQLVSVQRWSGGVWRTIASARLSSASQYRYALKPGARGTWRLRVVKGADGDHLVACSPTRTLYVG